MFVITLVCSDPRCPEVVEAWAAMPADADALICEDCGCGLQPVDVSGAGEARARIVIELPRAA